MNKYKQNFFSTASQLLYHRLSVSQKEMTEYWYSLTLKQIEKVLSIHDQYLIYQIIVQHYLQYYLRNKKVTAGEYFYVMYQDKILMWVYDCKIFRAQIQGYPQKDSSLSYLQKPSQVSEPSKENNDLMSAFLIGYREHRNNEKPENESEEIFQFLNFADVVKEGEWILKVKESALLRIFPYLIQKLVSGSGLNGNGTQQPKMSNSYTDNGSSWGEYRTDRQAYRNSNRQPQNNVRSSYSTSSTQSNTFYQPERNPIGLPYLTSNPSQRHQVVMLEPTSYYAFVYNLLVSSGTNNLSELSGASSHNTNSVMLSMLSAESTVNSLFNYLTELMLNNLLLSWYEHSFKTSLQKHHRHFSVYFRLIEKPKIKEEFTSIETYFTEIKWQSFALPLYALKYHIVERDMVYECYQKELKEEDLLIKQPYSCDGYIGLLGEQKEGLKSEMDSQHSDGADLLLSQSEEQSLLWFTEQVQYWMQNISILKAFSKRHKQYNYQNDYHYRERHYDPSLPTPTQNSSQAYQQSSRNKYQQQKQQEQPQQHKQEQQRISSTNKANLAQNDNHSSDGRSSGNRDMNNYEDSSMRDKEQQWKQQDQRQRQSGLQEQNCGQQRHQSNNGHATFNYRQEGNNDGHDTYNKGNKKVSVENSRLNKGDDDKGQRSTGNNMNNISNNGQYSLFLNPLQSNNGNPSSFYEQIIRQYNAKLGRFHAEYQRHRKFKKYLGNESAEGQNRQVNHERRQKQPQSHQQHQQHHCLHDYSYNPRQSQRIVSTAQRKQLKELLVFYQEQTQVQLCLSPSANWFMANYDEFYLHFYNQFESLSSNSSHSFKYQYEQLYHQFQDQQFMYNFEIVLLNLEFQVMKALLIPEQKKSSNSNNHTQGNSVFDKLEKITRRIKRANQTAIEKITEKEKVKETQEGWEMQKGRQQKKSKRKESEKEHSKKWREKISQQQKQSKNSKAS